MKLNLAQRFRHEHTPAEPSEPTLSRRVFVEILIANSLYAQIPPWSGNSDQRRTGLFYDPAMVLYDYGPFHPESPQRITAIMTALSGSSVGKDLIPVTPLLNPLPHIQAVHSAEHLEAVSRAHPTAYRAALVACSGVLGAAESVCKGVITNAFCCVRPPGHHAANGKKPRGYCYINHVAVAAFYCLHTGCAQRVLIVDWDYHRGDGTQLLTAGSRSIWYFSTHNRRAFPGNSRHTHAETVTNIHVGTGCTDEKIKQIWECNLIPLADFFRPDIILVSAGFDGMAEDPQGRWRLTERGYAALTRLVMDIAERYCSGRLVSVLEGGYDTDALARAAIAHISTLSAQ